MSADESCVVFFAGNVLLGSEKGIRLKQYRSLSKYGGLIPQCTLLRLTPTMDVQNPTFLHPDDDTWSLRPDGLVERIRHPGWDVKRMIVPDGPNGVGGIVEVVSLRNKSQAEVDACQRYFFEAFDFTREHTIDAIDLYLTSLGDPQYKQIRKDLQRSCREYRKWAAGYVRRIMRTQGACMKRGIGFSMPIASLVTSQLALIPKN